MRSSTAVAVIVLALAAAACGAGSGSGSGGSPSPTRAGRPSSTAKLSILEPENGSVVHGSSIHIRLQLKDAHVVKPTSTELQPDEGHIHVLLDGKLVSMNYGLDDVIQEVDPGPHLLQVEFVANDHAPFDPRVVVVSSFEVKQ
jgi:hypothetical protein